MFGFALGEVAEGNTHIALWEVVIVFGSVDQTASRVIALTGFAVGKVANIFSSVDQTASCV